MKYLITMLLVMVMGNANAEVSCSVVSQKAGELKSVYLGLKNDNKSDADIKTVQMIYVYLLNDSLNQDFLIDEAPVIGIILKAAVIEAFSDNSTYEDVRNNAFDRCIMTIS